MPIPATSKSPSFRPRLLATGLAALLAAGCASVPATTSAPEHAAALALLEQGQAREAATRLEAQAQAASGARREALLADAAFAWHEAGDAARARSLLAQVDARRVAGASRGRLALLGAELAIQDGRPAEAAAALAGGDPATLPAALQPRWQLARAAALEAGNDARGAAAARARADAGLAGEARLENRRQIDRLLGTLDDAGLGAFAAALPAGDPLYKFAARAMVQRGLPLPRPLDPGEGWNFDSRPPAAADGYRPPRRLAVLLPLSGPLATAAAPVRDGLLAGYYGETRQRPEVVFYDTAGTPAGAQAAYARAVAEGSDFVVGPLGRDEVGAVFRGQALEVPSLALNRGDAPPPPGHAMFSLAPEDDGLAAADYLLARERRNVLVLAGTDENALRAVEAFRSRLADRGGHIAATLSVGEQPGDLGAALVEAAAAGADSVFLAVRGPQARALAPQLALAGFAARTRVGTSQLASGTGRAEEDAVLDGIVYPTEAWATRGTTGLPGASRAAEMLPTARGPAARLFAFGYDAWRISAYLESLLSGTNGQLRGATGDLRLDGFGNVVRQPAWATFSGGQPVPLGN
ncbi:LppC family lipoprotein [Pseudoxanthomonas sp. SGNA-20]|nr:MULTISPECIES: penicillin-binding protein activator [unclassified Pseudoxanthomonas]RRN58821.1 LppC family lipoprotein [Pseudoxanthomonas sp. SGNA-20]